MSLFRMPPFPVETDTDQVVLYDVLTGQIDGDLTANQGHGNPLATLACCVQDAATATQLTTGQWNRSAPFGMSHKTIRFRAFPGAIVGGQRLNWTTHWGLTKTPVAKFTAEGPAQQIGVEWVLAVNELG